MLARVRTPPALETKIFSSVYVNISSSWARYFNENFYSDDAIFFWGGPIWTEILAKTHFIISIKVIVKWLKSGPNLLFLASRWGHLKRGKIDAQFVIKSQYYDPVRSPALSPARTPVRPPACPLARRPTRPPALSLPVCPPTRPPFLRLMRTTYVVKCFP